MFGFFNSFAPIIKHLKKHKLETGFIFLGIIFAFISALQLIIALNFTNSDPNIVINKNLDDYRKNIYIDVGGAVIKPDMYEVTSGARLKQAIELAGGLSEQSHKEYFFRNFNLARIVTDQEKIYIPSITELNNGIITENPRTLDYSLSTIVNQNNQLKNSSEEQTILVNINSSSIEELDTLPGIGAATAQKIIQNRPYKLIEDLVNKKVVKKNVFEQIKALVSLN